MSPARPLLVCGIAAPLLSVATDVLAISRATGYRPVTKSISELTAVGAPTRPWVTALDLTRDALLAACAAGVSATAGGNRALAATGGLMAANAAFDGIAMAALPRDYAEPTWAPRNTANTVVMAAGVGCLLAAMGTGAAGVRGPFRAFSAGIPISFGVLTILSGLLQSSRQVQEPSTGAQERTMAYSSQLWVAVLAGLLLRREARSRLSGPV